MHISPTKAVKKFKVSKPTLYEDMKSGKLAFSKNSKGRRQLDTAELSRVYEPRKEQDETKSENKDSSSSATKPNKTEHSIYEKEKELLEKELDMLKEKAKLQEKMIEDWQEAFNKAQKTADKITALIEHAGSGSSENPKVQELERRVDDLITQNQKLLAMEQKREKARQLRREQEQKHKERLLEAEQNKGFFQKLFG